MTEPKMKAKNYRPTTKELVKKAWWSKYMYS